MFSETHGGLDWQELSRAGLNAGDVLDFSVNSNPFGPAPAVRKALRTADLASYPQRNSPALCERLAEANGVTFANVLVGNGTAELIWLVVHAFVRPGDTVLICAPTFGEYARAAVTVGARLVEWRAAPPDFGVDAASLQQAIDRTRPRLVFVCNPNNPTGQTLPPETLRRMAGAHSQTMFVLDEAYRSFVDGELFAPPAAGWIVLRSMTKDFALAGLRLGYALADGEQLAAMRRYQPPWSVNALAQTAGLAVFADLDYYRRSLARLSEVAAGFKRRLQRAGFAPVDAPTHYFLLPTSQPATTWRARLLAQGVNVRDGTSFGLPEHVRISTRLPAANRRLLAALCALSETD